MSWIVGGAATGSIPDVEGQLLGEKFLTGFRSGDKKEGRRMSERETPKQIATRLMPGGGQKWGGSQNKKTGLERGKEKNHEQAVRITEDLGVWGGQRKRLLEVDTGGRPPQEKNRLFTGGERFAKKT